MLFFLLPSAAPLVLFTLAPMVSSVWVSLHKWNLISPMKWVGVDNYLSLLTDPETSEVFQHTLMYVVGYLPLVYVGGLGLALALNQRLHGRSFLRATYFLPVVTSWVVVALVWKWMLNPTNGLVNQVLGTLGLPQPGWWTDPTWALPSVILASAWKDLGFVMVILLAGLQAIPADLLAAAQETLAVVARDLDVDGGVHRFRADVFYGGGQWPLLSALLGWNLAAQGDQAAALRHLRWIAAQATPDGHLPEQVPSHLLHHQSRAEWIDRWGSVATPLLWSHGMYLILADELGLTREATP